MQALIDLFLHFDVHLAEFVARYGTLVYGLLFAIVFAETGLVVTPFLPGDSLLFAAGALAATGALDVRLVLVLLAVAAVLGNTVNYSIGRFVGPRVFRRGPQRRLAPAAQSRIPRPRARLFRAARRQGGRAHALRAHHQDVRAVRGRGGGDALLDVRLVQRGRGAVVGRYRVWGPATCSATCR